jgi:hypothetical protein
MKSLSSVIIQCDSFDRIIGATDAIMPLLSREVARKLNRVKLIIYSQGGKKHLFDCFNGRSVAEILEASKEILESQPIASGEVEGMRFELFEKPGTPDCDSLGPAS